MDRSLTRQKLPSVCTLLSHDFYPKATYKQVQTKGDLRPKNKTKGDLRPKNKTEGDMQSDGRKFYAVTVPSMGYAKQ